MKRVLITASLLLAFSWTVLAQQAADAPASKEDVERYFQITRSREMLDKMIEAMSKPVQQMIHEQCEKGKDKLPPDCEVQMNKIIGDMWKRMPWDEMLQAMVPAYQKHFTKGDIDALVAFLWLADRTEGPAGNACNNGRSNAVYDAQFCEGRWI